MFDYACEISNMQPGICAYCEDDLPMNREMPYAEHEGGTFVYCSPECAGKWNAGFHSEEGIGHPRYVSVKERQRFWETRTAVIDLTNKTVLIIARHPKPSELA